MRVLIIEDERKLADYLCKGLTENSYVVDVARDGINGLHAAREGSYDIVLLDVMLPGIDGYMLLKELRRDKPTHVIMITARDQVEDRIRGLEGGADDYLVKPFAFSELLARIQAVLRRGTAHEPTSLYLGDLSLDFARRRVMRAGARIDLTAKEFNLLALLLRHHGEVISRTVLAEKVWEMNFDGDTNAIEVAVRRLRAKLDDPFDTKLLHTVRGMGYVLELRDS
ncbi:response regulator [Allopusillimonas ginsengisoli]|nr:response regulator [Allopusillimonas ginsengisoli]